MGAAEASDEVPPLPHERVHLRPVAQQQVDVGQPEGGGRDAANPSALLPRSGHVERESPTQGE